MLALSDGNCTRSIEYSVTTHGRQLGHLGSRRKRESRRPADNFLSLLFISALLGHRHHKVPADQAYDVAERQISQEILESRIA